MPIDCSTFARSVPGMSSKDTKIHVLHVMETLCHFGGTPVKLLYQVLNSSPDFKFTICCVVAEGGLASEFRKAGAEVIALNHHKNYDLRQIGDIISIIKSRNIDIVHTHFARSNTFGRIAAILTGHPVIVSEHGIVRNNSVLVLFFDNVLNLFTVYLVANSRSTLASVQRKVLFNRANMSVIYNGVPDMPGEYLNIPKNDLKREHGFKSDDFLILNVGGHIPARNTIVLIETVARIRPLIPKLKVVQVGDGSERGRLEAAIEEHGLKDILFLWGITDREKIHRFIRAADVYVNPDLLEGFGIATVEAMLCELPVVCADSGSLPELVEHEKSGLLFGPKDVDGLSRYILSLYRSPELRQRLGRAARETALDKFNIKRFVSSFEEKYRSMYRGGGSLAMERAK